MFDNSRQKEKGIKNYILIFREVIHIIGLIEKEEAKMDRNQHIQLNCFKDHSMLSQQVNNVVVIIM